MSIWTILFGFVALMVVLSVIGAVMSAVVGIKHRNDPDPPLSGRRQ